MKFNVGPFKPLPPNDIHAVSLSIPSVEHQISYTNKDESFVKNYVSGYPRNDIHYLVVDLYNEILKTFGEILNEQYFKKKNINSEEALKPFRLNSSKNIQDPKNSKACSESDSIISNNNEKSISTENSKISILIFFSDSSIKQLKEFLVRNCPEFTKNKFWISTHYMILKNTVADIPPHFYIACFPNTVELNESCHLFCKLSGYVITSRFAEYVLREVKSGSELLLSDEESLCKFPDFLPFYLPLKYNPKQNIIENYTEIEKTECYKFTPPIYDILKEQLADFYNAPFENFMQNKSGYEKIDKEDIFIFPNGTNAIYIARLAFESFKPDLKDSKSIIFGFSFAHTMKLFQSFGGGCKFIGHSNMKGLEELKDYLENTEDKNLLLYLEFPSNPLLESTDFLVLQEIAKKYHIPILVDDTISTSCNVRILEYVDALVTSLTKSYAGFGVGMGGSLVLNKNSIYYEQLKKKVSSVYELLLWPSDAISLYNGGKTVFTRVITMSNNARAVASLLNKCPLVEKVLYPEYCEKDYYDKVKIGGYGSLMSVKFIKPEYAKTFYNNLDIAKGPSFGMDFSIAIPYVLAAHSKELEWAVEFGAYEDLIRISIGIEPIEDLINTFNQALASIKPGGEK